MVLSAILGTGTRGVGNFYTGPGKAGKFCRSQHDHGKEGKDERELNQTLGSLPPSGITRLSDGKAPRFLQLGAFVMPVSLMFHSTSVVDVRGDPALIEA